MKKLLALASSVILGSLMLALTASSPSAAPGAAGRVRLVTRGPVLGLAADGDRAALIVGGRSGCASVIVWEPMRRRVVRLQSATRCESGDVSWGEGTLAVALAGTRAAWLHRAGGNFLETTMITAPLARPTPVLLAFALSFGGARDFARRPAGDGTLLAFTVDRRCETEGSGPPCPPGRKAGDVVKATVWRFAGRGRCPVGRFPPGPSVRRCSRVARADGELSVLAVDAGRIAVRTDSGVRLLTATGRVLQDFAVKARAAALSGTRLAVRTADAVEVYDTGSGQRTARFPAASHLRLEDLDRDILVTALGRAVTLRRLGDGRTTTIRAGGTARAQLERPGLFVAGRRRVTFTPMREVLRLLGGKQS